MRVLIVEDKVKLAGQLWRALRGEAMAADIAVNGADLQMATASAIEETERLGRLADDLLLLTRNDSDRFELRRAPVSLGR
jgi:DNA-binding response OmpR family regulator